MIKKSKPTWKHENEAYKLYPRVFWIFLPNFIKINPYNFELYTISKLGCFLRHSVYVFLKLRVMNEILLLRFCKNTIHAWNPIALCCLTASLVGKAYELMDWNWKSAFWGKTLPNWNCGFLVLFVVIKHNIYSNINNQGEVWGSSVYWKNIHPIRCARIHDMA